MQMVNILNILLIRIEFTKDEKPIAVGASGKVYRGTFGTEEVAVKVCFSESLSWNPDEFKREVVIMRYTS